MKPRDLARRECCNCIGDKCLQHNDQVCDVLCGKRCRYFEHSVLPIADQGDPKLHRGLAKQRHEVRVQYFKMHRQSLAASAKYRRERGKS